MPNKDILNHILMPKFRILKEDEANTFLKERGIKKEFLPIIKHNDPVIALIDAKRGDIIEIERKSAFGGSYLYYRLVD